MPSVRVLATESRFCVFSNVLLVFKVLAGSAEFRTLNTPEKDRPEEAREISKLYRQLYRVSRHENFPFFLSHARTRLERFLILVIRVATTIQAARSGGAFIHIFLFFRSISRFKNGCPRATLKDFDVVCVCVCVS